MELQWPLILFTTFVAWSCGLYAVQNVAAARGESKAAQTPALIASFALLCVGGIAVFFHLQHWERIFNGFGHLTSGITQELIAIVIMVVIMVVQFSFLRRNQGECPAWLNWAGVVVAVLLVIVAGHSYMMPSRPAWNSVFEALGLLGGAAALGAGTFAVIEAAVGESAWLGKPALVQIFVWANVVLALAYVAACQLAGGSYIDMGYTWNPTRPTSALPSADMYSPLAGSGLIATCVALVSGVAAGAFSAAGSKIGWKAAGVGIVACALVSVIALRVMFYLVGGSAYLIY